MPALVTVLSSAFVLKLMVIPENESVKMAWLAVMAPEEQENLSDMTLLITLLGRARLMAVTVMTRTAPELSAAVVV